MEATLQIDNLGKRTGITDANITHRIQEIEERSLEVEDTKKILTQKSKMQNEKRS